MNPELALLHLTLLHELLQILPHVTVSVARLSHDLLQGGPAFRHFLSLTTAGSALVARGSLAESELELAVGA